MKGYAQTPISVVQQATDNCKNRWDKGPAILDKGIALYYEKHYVNGGAFHKWWHRNDTPREYVRSQISTFDTWDDILCDVLDEEELDILSGWCWDRGQSAAKECRALVQATDQDYVMLGEELAKFVLYWRNV